MAANIEQLCAIDQTIAELMSHASSALKALGNSESIAAAGAPDSLDADYATSRSPVERLEAFQAATNTFLATLHSIDVRMKRQLWALEEADILRFPEDPASDEDEVDTGNDPSQRQQDPRLGGTKKPKAKMAPDARGMFGGLDVGWLNSRIMSSVVEKQTEAELWGQARALLEGRDSNAGPVALEGDYVDDAMLDQR